MARLNEPPQPENVSLREQIIKLHYEVEKNTSRLVQDNVNSVKAKLEAKLTELGVLVQDLGRVQDNVESQSTHKRKSLHHSSPKRSPDQKNWKNALTLSEVTGGADGRLPPIVEDKYYPRRTMDAGELHGIFADPANVTDSPDLGPPPVAHFEDGDPIKFDSTLENPKVKGNYEAMEEGQPVLSANLETRKKRRESSHHKDAEDRRSNVKPGGEATHNGPAASMSQPLKSGAKRKLHVREEEDQPRKFDDQAKDAFQFNRKASEASSAEMPATKPNLNRTSKPINEKASQTAAGNSQFRKEKPTEAPISSTTTGGRKILGPKSINTDPVSSPAKLRGNGKDKVAEAKDDLAKIVRERNRAKDKAHTTKKSTSNKAQESDIAVTAILKPAEAPPETPAPPITDMFSPTTSEPSAARPDSQDTPPPADLGPDTGTGSFGRASRRPRGSVSYAQPNLRDKMRRPTAELVDAVGAEQRARQARAEMENSNLVGIKQEERTDALPLWKTKDPHEGQRNREEPTSPLVNKTAGSGMDMTSNVITERRRRTIMPSDNGGAEDAAKGSSGASSAIAALTAGSRGPKKREGDKANPVAMKDEEVREKIERLSIYDFTGSSPADAGSHQTSDEVEEEPTMPTRSSRRHSSVPASSEYGKGSLVISRRGDRRRESILEAKHEDKAEKGSEPQLSRSRSVIEPGPGREEVAMGRGERAASRRRSMML
ncbi:hypothetical protein P7C71_g4557, partial [Lecanoromycetidae sp. Uapishka_2]